MSSALLGHPKREALAYAMQRSMESTIGQRIRAARLARNVSQTQAAVIAGIGGPHLSKIEKGEDRPSLEVVARLAAGLGLHLTDLIGDDHELAGWELVGDSAEKAWLMAFRTLPPEQRDSLLAVFTRRTAA